MIFAFIVFTSLQCFIKSEGQAFVLSILGLFHWTVNTSRQKQWLIIWLQSPNVWRQRKRTLIWTWIIVILAHSELPMCSSSCEPENSWKEVLKLNFTVLMLLYRGPRIYHLSKLSQGGFCACTHTQARVWVSKKRGKQAVNTFHKDKQGELFHYLEQKKKKKDKATVTISFPWLSAAPRIPLFKMLFKRNVPVSLETVFTPQPRGGTINTRVWGRSKL